ncbi:MAG: hypothetical protein ACUZ8I_14585 [Candidatus Scalindua sp.]
MPKFMLHLYDSLPTTNLGPDDKGVKTIAPRDFEDSLYNFENLQASGIPSLFAQPLIFSEKLEKINIAKSNADDTTLEQFSTLIKGIFLGLIEIVDIPFDNLDVLGEIAKYCQGDLKSFGILKWRNVIIGGIYPKCLVFPGAQFENNECKYKFDLLKEEIEEQEGKLDLVNVKYYFKDWITNLNKQFVEKYPIGPKRLLDMLNWSEGWSVEDIERNIINYPTFSEIEGGVIELKKMEIEGHEITFERYIKEGIICEKTRDGIPFNLCTLEETLSLGNNKAIICRNNQGNLICGGNCNAQGVGPNIEEAGFFETIEGEGNYKIWKGFGDDISYPEGSKHIFPKGKSEILLHYGRLKVRIKGEIVTREELFCEKIAKFTDAPYPDMPIKSKYIDYIKDVKIVGSSPTASYEIKLKGMKTQETITWNIVEDENNKGNNVIAIDQKPSILIWPKFEAENWKVNYILFLNEKDPPKKAQGQYLIRFICHDKEYENEEGKLVFGTKTNTPVKNVEINFGDKPMGVYRVNRELKEGNSNADLCLDFGTSNTIFAYKRTGAPESVELFLSDQTLDLLGYDQENNSTTWKDSYWFPTYKNFDSHADNKNAVGISKQLTSSTTELSFRDEKYIYDPKALKKPITNYSLPHPYPDIGNPSFFRYIYSNFKWEYVSGEKSQSQNQVQDYNMECTKVYIKTMLHMALAALKHKGFNNVFFTATYPLAFGGEKYPRYVTILKNLVIEMHEDTGMEISMMETKNNKVELIPESHAAIAPWTPRGYQLVVDIGGGTTDIALKQTIIDDIDGGTTGIEQKQPEEQDKSPLKAFDSIKYGGNIILKLLAGISDKGLLDILGIKEDSLIQSNFTKDIISDKEKENINIISKKVRESDGINITNDECPILQMIELFYEGLFQYLNILLKSKNIDEDLTFYPVGNAWNFIIQGWFPPQDEADKKGDFSGKDPWIIKKIKEYFKNNTFNKKKFFSKSLHLVQENCLKEKKIVSTGALKLMSLGTFKPPEIDFPVSTIVGCKVQIENIEIPEYQSVPVNLTNKGLSKKYSKTNLPRVLIDKKCFDEAFPFKTELNTKDKNEGFYKSMQDEFNTAAMAKENFYSSREGLFLVKSLYVVFLENIFPKYLSNILKSH